MKIAGFDPGYGILGWGVLSLGSGSRTFSNVSYGVIRTGAGVPMHERLAAIRRESEALLEEHRPDVVVVEKLYMNKNIKTAGDVFQARGVLLATVAEFGCELSELNPNTIKQMITGRGQADKREVILMVRRLLNISGNITPDDAADALAGALCGAFLARSRTLLNGGATVI